jgi:pentatricopeptide repeat protein
MAQVEEVLRIVMEVPRDAVNAPVWNMVFAMLGREKKLDRMWKAFNDVRLSAMLLLRQADDLHR